MYMRQKRVYMVTAVALARNIPSRVQHPCAIDTAGRSFQHRLGVGGQPSSSSNLPSVSLSCSDLVLVQSEIPGLDDSTIATTPYWTIFMPVKFHCIPL